MHERGNICYGNVVNFAFCEHHMSKVIGIGKKTTAASARQTAYAARPHSTLESVLRQLQLTSTFGLTVTIIRIEPQMYFEILKDLETLGFMLSFEKGPCTGHEIYLEVDWTLMERIDYE